MKKRVFSRIICLVLASVMLLGVMPVQAASSVLRRVYTVGDSSYPLLIGTISETTSQIKSEYYYSDGYFMSDSTVYDPHLSTMSLLLSTSYMEETGDTAVKSTLQELGYGEIYSNEYSQKGTASSDSVAYTFATKKIKTLNGTDTGKTIVAVALRSTFYGQEWVTGFTYGAEGESKGYSACADVANEAVNTYIADHDLTEADAAGNVIYWVTGFSRGGTIGNLTAKRIIDRLDESGLHGQVFCYTSATSQGAAENSELYNSIHSIVSLYDVVTQIIPTYNYGVVRYGQDHDITDVAFTDAWWKQLHIIAPDMNYPDPANFHTAYTTVGKMDIKKEPLKSIYSIINIMKNMIFSDDPLSCLVSVNNEVDVSMTQFLKDLCVNYTSDTWIGTRKDYATETFTALSDSFEGSENVTLEQTIGILFGVYFSLDESERTNFLNCVVMGSVKATVAYSALHLSELADYMDYIYGWNTTTTVDQKAEFISFVWSIIDSATYDDNGKTMTIKDYLSANDYEYYKLLKSAFPEVADAALRVMMQDYDMNYAKGTAVTDKRLYIIATVAYNLLKEDLSLLAFNVPAPYLAALRTEDSFYQYEYGVTVNGSSVESFGTQADNTIFAVYNSAGRLLRVELVDLSVLENTATLNLSCEEDDTWKIFHLNNDFVPVAAATTK